jgi:hypothetical protein
MDRNVHLSRQSREAQVGTVPENHRMREQPKVAGASSSRPPGQSREQDAPATLRAERPAEASGM